MTRNMIIYGVITTYHLLEAIAHKLNMYSDESADILIPSWITRKHPWYKNLHHIFNRVILYDAGCAYDCNFPEKTLDFYFEGLFKKNDIALARYDEIHILGAEHSFGVYAAVHALPFVFWEEGTAALSKMDQMIELFTAIHGKEKTELYVKLGLIDGKNPCIVKRICNMHHQIYPLQGDDLEHFDLVEQIGLLSGDKRRLLLGLFGVEERWQVSDDSVLLLTEHSCNLGILSWEEQVEMYQTLIDYFFSDRDLVIKPHPDDLVTYESYFKNAQVIRKTFPSELIPYVFARSPDCIATVSSSGIYALRSSFNKAFELNSDYLTQKHFFHIHRYYFALIYAQRYIDQGYSAHTYGTNSAILKNFFNFKNLGMPSATIHKDTASLSEIVAHSVVMIDANADSLDFYERICIWLKQLPDEVIVIFINSSENFCFYQAQHRQIWENIMVLELTKSVRYSEALYTGLKPERIYFYKKGDIKMENMHVNLINTGIAIEAEGLCGDKRQIAILEAMLEASEKRILYCLKQLEYYQRKEEKIK